MGWSAPRREQLALVAVVAILGAFGLGGAWVLDDGATVVRNPVVVGEVPWYEAFVREFRGHPLEAGWASSYRPLSVLSFALVWRVTPEPWLQHLVNVVLYAVLVLQVRGLARRWVGASWAFGAALFFAVLPIHVESVASVVGRADILASVLALAALDRLRAPEVTRGQAATAAGLYLAALLTKETVALTPALAAWLRLQEPRRARALAAVLPMVVTAAVYLVLRQRFLPTALPQHFVGADNQLRELAGAARAWGVLAVLGHYAELTVLPLRLCSDHTYADVVPPSSLLGAGALQAWLGALLLVPVVADVRRALRGAGPGLWTAAALAFALVGQWVVPLSVIVAERLALWPTVWLVVAVAAAVEVRARGWSPQRRRLVLGAFVVVALSFGARFAERSLDWRSALALHGSTARACPAAIHNRIHLAAAFHEAGNPAQAVWHTAVAAAGRSAYPQPFAPEALAAEEAGEPLEERLARLPELLGWPDGRSWAGLQAWFEGEGWLAEARLVARLQEARRGS
jgi:hypothetical protein